MGSWWVWVLCLLTYTLQCGDLPLLEHSMSSHLLGLELIPSLNRAKGRDAWERHWGLLLPKSDHSCHIDPSPHKTAWHNLIIISFVISSKASYKEYEELWFRISKSLLKKETCEAKSLALLMSLSFPGLYKGNTYWLSESSQFQDKKWDPCILETQNPTGIAWFFPCAATPSQLFFNLKRK